MRPLVLPKKLQNCAFVLFKEIADAKHNTEKGAQHREVLSNEELRERVRVRYAEYAHARSRLETLHPCAPPLAQQQRVALESCYGSTKLQPVKAVILRAQPSEICATCPYCGIGEIGHPDAQKKTERLNEWDHYFPQADYAEYSAFPPNLIPCCSTCNKRKPNQVIDDQGKRRIIHFYYDRFDHREPLLSASISVAGCSPDLPRVVFEFLPATADSDFGRLFVEHCNRLGLFERYSSKAREQIGALPGALKRRRHLTPVAIAEELEARADDAAETRGANHWSTVFYRAAARSSDFVDYCRGGP